MGTFQRIYKGFTLIEVLIALVIIAVALAAVMQSMNQSIRVASHVKTVMASHWAQMNALSEIQLGMIRLPEFGNPVNGKTTMFGSTVAWEANAVSGNTLAYAWQVNVGIKEGDKTGDLLQGFVAK